MGFYSIYKIIKDVIRTLFGNKFLKIFLIVCIVSLVIVFVNNSNVFANLTNNDIDTTNVTISIDNHTFNVPKGIFDYYDSFLFVYTSGASYPYRIYYGLGDIYVETRDYYYYYCCDNGIGLVTSYNGTFDAYQFEAREQLALTTEKGPNSRSSDNFLLCTNDLILDNSSTLLSSSNIYDINGDLLFPTNPFISPSLNNSQSELENLSFNNFIINANSFTQEMISNPDEPLVMLFYNRSLSNSQNTDGLYPIKEKYFYKESIYYDRENSTDSNYVFKFPIFKTGVFFNVGSTYEIKFAKRVYISEYNTWGYDYFANSYTFTVSSNVTQDYINQLNQQTATSSDEEQQQQLNDSINQQTQSIDNINNSITDSNVDNSSIDLPTDNTQNPTQSGIDNIFQTIYNGFTKGAPQDIVFPLPYSSNNITIKPNYITQMLNSSERRANRLLSHSSFLLVRNK